MNSSEVRQKYLKFFEERGHTIIPSASIRPENDPTTLFVGSGMQPLIPYLLGEKHPKGIRLTNSQKCFRAEDIEEVGDNRHTTFFEMLGNWSLGDYFKQEQLPWFFEFLTDKEKGVGLDPEKLYITAFLGDEKLGVPKDNESVEIWKRLFKEKGIDAKDVEIGSEEDGYKKGMRGGRIFYYDAKKNWWSRSGTPENMPVGEPGGPDSEVFYDFGGEHDKSFGENCHPNCDCGRFMEIGNNVFMEYIKKEDGSFETLPQKNVDF
ncbi:alanine--tRNA ligase-related protein, partial [candidate division KSB1 bacterium]